MLLPCCYTLRMRSQSARLTFANSQSLMSLLKGEELSTSDYLLKIFKVSIPHMPKTAAKFGHELQAALQPMIIKPSGAGGVQVR